MGRTRTQKKAHTKVTGPPVQHAAAKAPSIPSLLEKAQSFIVQCDYELALRFTRRILEQDPKNAEAREMLGVCLLETGEVEAAKEAFLSLLPPNPDAPASPPASAYLYLAQLSDDDPKLALQHFQAAVNILLVQLKGKERATDDNSSDEVAAKNNIVRALVGQVEIWMDPLYDLWCVGSEKASHILKRSSFEPEAEKTCEDLLANALQVDPGNPEALQSLASVRMSQQRPDDAKQCLEHAWSRWKDLDLDDPKLPPIPSRLVLVKLFIELAMYTPALLVLHGIMSSDDQEVEAWYLEGWCFYLMAEQAQESGGTLDELTWQELAKDSRDCLETCQVLHRNQEHIDKPLLGHVKELIAKLNSLGISASPLEDAKDGGDDDDDWESDDGSVDGDGDVEMK